MKIKLDDATELAFENLEELQKHREELVKSDERKQKIINDMKDMKTKEPEVLAFIQSLEFELTPPDYFKVIDGELHKNKN